MGIMLRRVSGVAGWTLVSRILGLVRDVLIFASLGTGLLNSAFILAFTLPNLFRRLLGEGALATSSIPVLSERVAKAGRADAFHLLNGILVRLGAALLVIQLLVLPLFLLAQHIPGLAERWYVAADLSLLLFPYVLLICLSAMICGMLNVLMRFNLAASSQILLNCAMIGAMGLGLLVASDDAWTRALLLAGSVLVGGLLQFVVPAWGLRREGWQPSLRMAPHEGLSQLMRLFLPTLLGAAIFQINILVSRFLAFSLDDTATGLLYLASRLVELPLGVFAIAVTTVFFPELSRLSSEGRIEAFHQTFRKGLGFVMMITLPAAAGLIVLAAPILGSLFEWGLFDAGDVASAAPVLAAAAVGLPFFAWSNLLTRAWYARQSVKVPVRMSAVNLFVNVLLSLLLMRIWGAVGLALANAISSLLHCLVLQWLLPVSGERVSPAILVRPVAELGGALTALAATAWLCEWGIGIWLGQGKLADLTTLAIGIPAAAGAYFGLLWLAGHKPLRDALKRHKS